MLYRKVALSTDDIESGRFNQVAMFIRDTWPFDMKPSKTDALNILAQSLGYKDYAEAVENSSDVVIPGICDTRSISTNFAELSTTPQSLPDDEAGHLERLSIILGVNRGANEFVKTWPLDLINRWNFEGKGCVLTSDILKECEGVFEQAWCNRSISSDSFLTRVANSTSASVLFSRLCPNISVEEIYDKKVVDVVDKELAETVLQDIMPSVFSSLLSVNYGDMVRLAEATRMSMSDLVNLPRNEIGFPNLYSHLREFLNKDILNRPASSLFLRERNNDGMYTSPHLLQDHPGVEKIEVGSEHFYFSVTRDMIESEDFRTYTWSGQLQTASGDVLATASGSYISGSPTNEVSGFRLVSAADETNDLDVRIVDVVLSAFQEMIQDVHGQEVDKSIINTQLIFQDGNLVTLAHWERSKKSEKGSGVKLLELCLSRLKKKYKRNIHVACLIQPYQYTDDARLIKSLDEQFDKDCKKITKALMSLKTNPTVVGIYACDDQLKEGLSTFTEYCGSHFNAEDD